ncbi:ribonuclease H-like domain-containing protein [Halomarina litorea]|uniref:ribonuclease H-like domain-containing protein n=1 Tax=Halomarina litorea TaxID=2961595 RepID=UPI0020C31AB5|nr:ribonuclease H-like domain-containing protein [Halomarina sp. BCD28]
MRRAATVLSLPPDLAARLRPAELADLHAHAAPDAVLAPTRAVAPGRLRPPGSDTPVVTLDGAVHEVGDCPLVACRDAGDLAAVETWARQGRLGGTTYVLSDLLSLSVDTDRLATTLGGETGYRTALGDPDCECVHLAASLPADYRREWGGLVVQGVAPVETQGAPAVPRLTLYGDGTVAVEEVGVDRLGLRAVDGVGEKRAQTLREAGYDRSSLADAPIHELADLPGFGREVATSAVRSARAVERDELSRTGDAPLPDNPVFVDIETDGLRPSVVWQVGAMRDGEYRAFLARDPDEEAAMLDAFLDWFGGPSRGTLVAWNGWGFDFPVLEERIAAVRPDRLAGWRSACRFDPLRWARDEDNAVLPGRTNTLEAVAGALGFEGEDAGLTGAETARRYRAWLEGGPEPDWARHRTYCENDVRMLAHVFEALESTDRVAHANHTPDTRQGSLSEF